ncbi:acyl-CoA thioesterase [Jatrophihabitans sp.]|uniref:acyl-CoA thioesterase n=1 Tax=Jatrophihabitans sp. TaxID=1932789 RepID=UPI002CED5F52|nr:thioesterase family protein [Jatrophihabitans sp.]
MRWSDMDAYGHVNNTAYLAYLEQARVSMFFDRYDSTFAGGTLVTHHEITYLKPVVYHPEPLRLELWVERIRGASFEVRYDVYDGQTLAATAATTLVTFDFNTNRPRRLSQEERAILAGYTDEPSDPAPAGRHQPAAGERAGQSQDREPAGAGAPQPAPVPGTDR